MDQPLLITISSDFENARKGLQQIVDEAHRLGINAQDQFTIRLELEGVFVTAIKNGTGSDPERTIQIQARVVAKKFQVTIEANGPRTLMAFDLPISGDEST